MMKPVLKDIKMVSACIYLLLLLVVGLLAPLIATDGGLIPFGPTDVSTTVDIYESPGAVELDENGQRRCHFLGTDSIGQDVASRLIHGINVAFQVGVISSIISFLIAMLLGSLAGFRGDQTDRATWIQLLWLFLGALTAHFYAVELSYFTAENEEFAFHQSRYLLIMVLGLAIVYLGYKLMHRIKARKVWIKWDVLVTKLIEVFNSIPKLFLLLAIFAIVTRPSLWSVILIIGLIRWPGLTRLIRAEIINVKQEDFVKNAALMGLPSTHILVRHVLPNIYKPIMIITAIGMGNAILIESSLSFLQIGLPLDQVSWGRMLSEARDYIPAWWLALGPGLLIFSMILSFNVIGDRLSHHFGLEKSDL